MSIFYLLDYYFRLKSRADWRRKPSKIGNLHLGYVENYGVCKGLFKDKPKEVLKYQSIFVVCTVLYCIYLMFSRKRSLYQAGWMLIAIGGMGNLWDRAMNGFVTDYMSIDGKLYFNIADIFVFAGACMVFLTEIYDLLAKSKKVKYPEV